MNSKNVNHSSRLQRISIQRYLSKRPERKEFQNGQFSKTGKIFHFIVFHWNWNSYF